MQQYCALEQDYWSLVQSVRTKTKQSSSRETNGNNNNNKFGRSSKPIYREPLKGNVIKVLHIFSIYLYPLQLLYFIELFCYHPTEDLSTVHLTAKSGAEMKQALVCFLAAQRLESKHICEFICSGLVAIFNAHLPHV